MIQKYKIGFNLGGILLFLIIMIPNFIWFVIPAPNDVLRYDSVTAELDMLASVCQVLFIITLCLIVNTDSKKFSLTSPFIIIMLFSCFFYFIAWGIYYLGVASPLIILVLCIFPCIAFLAYAFDRKNSIAVILILIFTVCHLICGIANYIV